METVMPTEILEREESLRKARNTFAVAVVLTLVAQMWVTVTNTVPYPYTWWFTVAIGVMSWRLGRYSSKLHRLRRQMIDMDREAR